MITRGGKAVMSWGDTALRYDVKSTTKSIGGTALGLALLDGMLSIDDSAQTHLPTIGLPPDTNASTGWLDDIQLLHLATQTAGFDKAGGYTQLLFQPGTRWSYSDGGANWLADVLTGTFQADLNWVLFSRAFTPMGITTADLRWRSNAYREDLLNGVKRRELGAGITVNVNAMARIGYLYLRRGSWAGQRIVSGFLRPASAAAASGGRRAAHARPGRIPAGVESLRHVVVDQCRQHAAERPSRCFLVVGIG